MKKRWNVTIIVVIAALLIGAFSLNSEKESNAEKFSVNYASADFQQYEQLSELENNADSILKVEFAGTREVEEIFQDGIKIDSVGKTKVEVKEVYKGEEQKGNVINLYEPGYFEDGTFYTTEGYVPISDNAAYVVFLRNNGDGTYVGLGVYQGKYKLNREKPITEEEIKEVTKGKITKEKLQSIGYVGESATEFNELRTEVLNKYKP